MTASVSTTALCAHPPVKREQLCRDCGERVFREKPLRRQVFRPGMDNEEVDADGLLLQVNRMLADVSKQVRKTDADVDLPHARPLKQILENSLREGNE